MYLANILLENWIPIPDYNLDCPTTFNEQRTIRSRFEEKVNVIMSNKILAGNKMCPCHTSIILFILKIRCAGKY